MSSSFSIDALASALLAGEPAPNLLFDRCRRALRRNWRWLRPLTQRYLREDPGLLRACAKYAEELLVAEVRTAPQLMLLGDWSENIPSIESTGDLAKWLGLSPGELRRFADLKGLGYKRQEARLEHYHYQVLAKRFGAIRLIEAPRARLKDLQRQVLLWILQKLPAHPAAHGFVKERSIQTFAAPHVGRRVVLRMDLRDFFPTFGGVRIQNVFRTLGYPKAVADLLGGICTNATPIRVWEDLQRDLNLNLNLEHLVDLRRLYASPHLPQGAPTSPALANICCYRVDCRLSTLAKASGATYTRYADDLAFSGDDDFAKPVGRFGVSVAAILQEEGLQVNHHKTRVMRRGVRQHLAGLVTNAKLNVGRRDFDQLKAVLTKCIRHGIESQNREHRPDFRSHLQGRVSFVEMINRQKGKKLRILLERIPLES